MIIIDDNNYHKHLAPVIDGETKSRGGMPRPYDSCPVGYLACAKPFDLPIPPESEWPRMFEEYKANGRQLSKIRMTGKHGGMMPSTDQNGRGYCWAHSSTSACLLVRALNNQPYAELSAYSVACPIKNFRDQGGWGSESLEYIAEHGIATSATWPQKSTNRANVNEAMRAESLKYRVTEWMDMQPRNKAQLFTCLINQIPVVIDCNWWGHSICAMDIVSLNPWQILIWNSWGDSWSDHGMGILSGSKAIPDGMIAPRVLRAAA